MELIADILLAAGAFGAGFYCIILGRRLNRFNDLEKGVGGAVAVLSAQVDDLNRTLLSAQKSASDSVIKLELLVQRAENTERQLELQMASLSDFAPQKPPLDTKEAEADFASITKPDNTAEPMFVRRRTEGGAH